MHNMITAHELDAILAEPVTPALPQWLAASIASADVQGLSEPELCELAGERDERGPSATIAGLIEALRVRHAGDRVTLAMLAALELQHLPDLRDVLRGV